MTFSPRLNDSNKLFFIEHGHPREGRIFYAPPSPHSQLPIPNACTRKLLNLYAKCGFNLLSKIIIDSVY